MTLIRFFTDEDVYGHLAPQLRVAGFDVVSTPEAQRRGEVDSSQLARAAVEGRVVITFNIADYARLHHEWMSQDAHHAGIVISPQRPIGDVLLRLLTPGRTLNADEMRDRLEYLSNWSPI